MKKNNGYLRFRIATKGGTVVEVEAYIPITILIVSLILALNGRAVLIRDVLRFLHFP